MIVTFVEIWSMRDQSINSVMRRCRYEHRKSQTEQLVNSRSKNANNYWKMLKKIVSI